MSDQLKMIKDDFVDYLYQYSQLSINSSTEEEEDPAYITEQLLFRLFNIKRKRIIFIEEAERAHIGALIYASLPLLQKGIDRLSASESIADDDRICSANMLRSAVQFLIDDYCHLPVSLQNEETLENALQKLAQSDSLIALDDYVRRCNDNASGRDCFINYENVVDFEDALESHRWWNEREKAIRRCATNDCGRELGHDGSEECRDSVSTAMSPGKHAALTDEDAPKQCGSRIWRSLLARLFPCLW